MTNQFLIDCITTFDIPGLRRTGFLWTCSRLDGLGEFEHYNGTTHHYEDASWSSSARQDWPVRSWLDDAAQASRQAREQEVARRMSTRLRNHFAGRDPLPAGVIQRVSENNRHLSLRVASARPTPFAL